MDELIPAVALVAVAVAAFVASVRVGMLLGRRMDRHLEAGAAVEAGADVSSASSEEDSRE
jgi:NADH:ubiquinone oxidoreductase subunit 3 (subunit A)